MVHKTTAHMKAADLNGATAALVNLDRPQDVDELAKLTVRFESSHTDSRCMEAFLKINVFATDWGQREIIGASEGYR